MASTTYKRHVSNSYWYFAQRFQTPAVSADALRNSPYVINMLEKCHINNLPMKSARTDRAPMHNPPKAAAVGMYLDYKQSRIRRQAIYFKFQELHVNKALCQKGDNFSKSLRTSRSLKCTFIHVSQSHNFSLQAFSRIFPWAKFTLPVEFVDHRLVPVATHHHLLLLQLLGNLQRVFKILESKIHSSSNLGLYIIQILNHLAC